MASETVDPIDWSQRPPSWAVPPDRAPRIARCKCVLQITRLAVATEARTRVRGYARPTHCLHVRPLSYTAAEWPDVQLYCSCTSPGDSCTRELGGSCTRELGGRCTRGLGGSCTFGELKTVIKLIYCIHKSLYIQNDSTCMNCSNVRVETFYHD